MADEAKDLVNIIFIRLHTHLKMKSLITFANAGNRALCHKPLVKSAYQKNNFLISQPKHMLWVLKRTVSMRRFFWAPKTYAKNDE